MKRVGIIGIDKNANDYIARIQNSDDFELIGLYDHNAVEAAKFAKQFGVNSFTHPMELIENVEIINFGCSHQMDNECVVMAIKKAKHIFFEADFLKSANNAIKYMDLAEEAAVKIQVSRSDRFNPMVEKARQFIGEPKFIETKRMLNLNESKQSIDDLCDLLLKDLDLVTSFVNSEVRKIQTQTNNPMSSEIELLNVRIEFDNSCVANFNICSLSAENSYNITFYQENTIVDIDFMEKKLKVVKSNYDGSQKDVFTFDQKVDKSKIFDIEFKSFKKCIEDNSSPEVSLNEAANIIQIIDEIKFQIEAGKR